MMLVLFVEDDAMNRRVAKDMLQVAGAEMHEAPDAETGLRMLDERTYDIVLMDIRMPGMDGVTAIEHIRRKTGPVANIPVIVVTADMAPDLQARCSVAGAQIVIRKPVAMTELLSSIGRLISNSGSASVLLD